MEHRKGKAQPDQVAGHPVHLVGPDPQEDVVTGVFHGGYVRRNGLTHSGGGSVDPYHYLITVRSGADGLAHQAGGIVEFSWGERVAGQVDLCDAVNPERAPVLSVQVEGHQVPAPFRGYETVRLHAAGGLVTVPGAVIEVGQFRRFAALGQTGQVFGRHRLGCRQQRNRRRP